MSVRISAVVCTHNRAPYLRKAVRSLVEQTLPRELYEVIVVDNGSEDETGQVVEEFSAIPNLRYLYEPVLGLSRARNTGWMAARGEYVAYLDDDAVAYPSCLEDLVETYRSFVPRPGSVGGRCEPIWEAPRPPWLGDRMLGPLSVFHWSNIPTVLNERQWLSGCNISFRRELLEATGGFPEALGRRGESLLGGEEIYLRRQLDARGETTVYNPFAAVGHYISPHKLNKEWFKRAAFNQGLSDARMLQLDGGLPLASRVIRILGSIAWAAPRGLLMLKARDDAARFLRLCQLLQAAGLISGLLKVGPIPVTPVSLPDRSMVSRKAT